MQPSLPSSEYESRIARVRDTLAETEHDALCLFSSTSIEWVAGFYHLQTERPVCLAVTDDEIHVTVPRLELERAEAREHVDSVHHYYDYPGGEGTYPAHPSRTPETTIDTMLSQLEVESVCADANGAPGFWGYTGPTLEELADVDVDIVDWITEWRKVKSDAEIELIEQSGAWGNLAHEKLASYAEPGAHELWVAKRASLDASMAMLDTLGDRYESHLRGGFPASCGFLSGPNTALPHGLTENRRLQEGDVLITGATANVGGYVSELERTMFVGEPTDDQRHYFELMLEAQSIALDECGPGVPCARVDQAVHDYFDEQGVLEYAQHHTGHNIGMEGHERGFIDRGSDEIMQPGHVYSIEPGLYLPEEAGYRHSDTIVVTEDGTEMVTYYPRELEGNVIRW
ncbi:M24 family metallopeptidase [Natrarchaeobius chitinivorans]|uniref:Aminopeptidase P family protein n=1 Tax=Natrarchaeobius chitinivorans TaxID=1679083 RepID=A0A3N6MDI2_NATCH|nr:Xaa-Pro peptidase family protein [Natrarchaeobius chitinivorans]RQG93621.1 aminopeptidase P family protein [Natrarchaeobius chitinivorans]